MINKKVLILKNDRAGDLFTSLTLISSLISHYQNITLYLSEFNEGFSFFFKKTLIKKIKFNLTIINKILIFFDIFFNRYEKIYILTPKSFYFILPLIFRKIKFYAIVYDSDNKYRPPKFLRKYLYKYEIVYRNKLNNKSYRDLQSELIDDDIDLDTHHNALNIPKIDHKLKILLPKNFILFQFRYLFFNQLGWGINEFNYLITQIKRKYEFILFSSDIEKNKFSNHYNNYFKENFSIIDTNNYTKKINVNNDKIFYLENINSLNLFYLLKESEINLAKEGIFSHISYFHKTKCHNLFNFTIASKKDYHHQKISYSEWCKGMNIKFSFLNKDVKKSVRKILRNI